MKKPSVLIAIIAVLILPIFSCKKKGPAEKLGEKIDQAVEDVKDAVDKDGPAEKIGKEIDEAIKKEK